MTRHLVTGGSGFIGSRLATRLRRLGHEVRVLDVVRDPLLPPDVDFHQGSVCDRATVSRAVQGVDVLHHHAALVAQRSAGRLYQAVNVKGSRIVAEEAGRAGVGTFVHVSSTSIFGLPPKGPITRETTPAPFDLYGKSKLAGERIVSEICGQAGMSLIIVRPRATLGRGRLGIYQILFQWIFEGRRIFIIGDGENRMQFIHVDDLIDFILLAIDRGCAGSYNVGAIRFDSLGQELERLISHAGSRSRIVRLPVTPAITALDLLHRAHLSPIVPWQYRTYHRDCWFDTAPLESLGWTARYSNAVMLAEAYDWFCARPTHALKASAHRSTLAQRMIGLLRLLS